MDQDLAAEIAEEYEKRNLEVPPKGAIQQLVGNIEAGNRSMDDLRHALDRAVEKRAESTHAPSLGVGEGPPFEGGQRRGAGGRFLSKVIGGGQAPDPSDDRAEDAETSQEPIAEGEVTDTPQPDPKEKAE